LTQHQAIFYGRGQIFPLTLPFARIVGKAR
jgi:hypothetical protein